MLDQQLLTGEILSQIADRLGPRLTEEPTQDNYSLISSVDDHLFMWNARGQSVLAVNLNVRNEVRLQNICLENCVQHQVVGLSVSSSARRIALYGKNGVSVIEVPKRRGRNGRFGGGEEDIYCRSVTVSMCDKESSVQKVAWHPGALNQNHLVILTTDGAIRMYLVSDSSCHVVNSVSLGGSKVATALGETAVDFCFGAGVDTEDGEAKIWPIFALWADGAVYSVIAHLREEWSVVGPLEVLPENEDNYTEEASSICVLGGGQGPSLLAVARVGGSILHSVILGDPATGRLSLHIYERVELELGPLNYSDSVFTCPVVLQRDPCSTFRYLASHTAGLHQVEVRFGEELESGELAPGEDCAAVVEHLICTRPTSDSTPAPVLGATVSFPPTTILCLLTDHTLQVIRARPPTASTTQPPAASSTINGQVANGVGGGGSGGEGIVQRLREILGRSTTQPLILSGQEGTVSLAETLELLSRATDTLRQEYITKIVNARKDLLTEADKITGKRRSQEERLTRLEVARTELRENAERLSEKYEDVKDKGLELSERVERVLARVQSRVPVATDAELKMWREVRSLAFHTEEIERAIHQIREKEKYQRYQVLGANLNRGEDLSLEQHQADNIREVLQKDTEVIGDLVKIIHLTRKDVGL